MRRPIRRAARARPAGTCTSSSTRRCARPTSSSTSRAPSRGRARSSPTPFPRSLRAPCARRSPVPREASAAFAPGRVDLIGEHTDYNEGLALPCARVESEWVGAHTGLLDQLASLYGARETALLIDFQTLAIEAVPLRLDRWRLAVVDSGERHAHASSGYNERRAECRRACEALGVRSLREAARERVQGLPQPLRARAQHVLDENERVSAAVAALRAGEMPVLGELLNASHASLRDLYDVATPTVDATVARLLDAGATGARMIGGGFGGSVLGLFAPGRVLPPGAREVWAGCGARVVAP